MARYAEAERLYLQALDIWKTTIGENHPDCATTLHNLAGLYSTRGEYAAAERLYHQALGIERAVLGERHPDYAASLHNLALLYHTKGDYPQAERLYQQALEIWRAVLGDNHRNCASCLNNVAVLYVAMGREPQAMTLMNEAVLIDDRILQQVFSIGSESQRMAYLHDLREHADVFLSLVCKHMSQTDAAVRVGLDLVLRRKAIGAEALAAQRDTVWGGRYPALTQHLQALTTLRMQIAHKTLAGPGPEGLSTHRQLLAEWEARRDRLEAELARQIPEMTLAHRLQTADRRAIAQALSAGIVLVEFVRFDLFDFHAVPARSQTRWQSARYLAFILSAGEPDNVHMIDLGEAEPIDEMIAAFRASITGEAERLAGQLPAAPGTELSQPLTASDETAADETTRFARPTPMTPGQEGYGNEGTALRSALIDPLLTPLGERRRLFLAPDGDLARLPFGVLPMTNGGRLIDEYHISYLSVGRDMLRYGARLPGQLGKALVVADPDFDLREGNAPSVAALAHPHGRQSRDLNRRALCFTRLAGTRVEGERIAATLGVRPQLGAMALESWLKTCRSPRVLHIATHGFFLPDQQSFPHDEQRMLAAGGMADGKVERLWGQRLENPLLRSGLALAGANAWLRGGQPPMEAEDGLFTAEDVSGLDLLGTELVVLSACETGLGKVHAGEGVFGLRRTFVLAGAETLVMSLWKVPDQQTQELMVDFYRRILDGQPRAAALREAQLALKAQYPNPFYWGAFICQGDPGPLRDSTNPCCRG
jgi:CHAT domain-containing protein/tetratricopeptide (TPR) repeat protein